MSISPYLYANVRFDRAKAFQPVALVTMTAQAILVPARSPFKRLEELIAYGRKYPRRLDYASPGNGTPGHLTLQWLSQEAGMETVHIPYTGGAAMMTAVIGGQVDMGIDSMSTSLQQATTGNVRILAVTSAARQPALPQVPALCETIPHDKDLSGWTGVLAPAGTPADVVGRLNTAIREVMRSPDTVQSLARMSLATHDWTPQEFGAFLEKTATQWSRFARQIGVKLE